MRVRQGLRAASSALLSSPGLAVLVDISLPYVSHPLGLPANGWLATFASVELNLAVAGTQGSFTEGTNGCFAHVPPDLSTGGRKSSAVGRAGRAAPVCAVRHARCAAAAGV